MARYDDLNTGTIAYATFVSCIVFVLVVLLIRALCCGWIEGEEQRKLAEAHYYLSDQEISDQRARISGFAKEQVEVAPPEGSESTEPVMEERIHIPVENAKKLILEEMAQGDKEPSA